jgi:hypothetical protein
MQVIEGFGARDIVGPDRSGGPASWQNGPDPPPGWIASGLSPAGGRIVSMSRNERIAARLIAAIGPLVPASCTTSIHDGWLEVAIDGHVDVSISLAAGELPGREAVLAVNVLSTIQDVIVRASTRPWPPAADPTHLPYPEAEVRQGVLLAWFGSEAHPTVALPPIDLAAA